MPVFVLTYVQILFFPSQEAFLCNNLTHALALKIDSKIKHDNYQEIMRMLKYLNT